MSDSANTPAPEAPIPEGTELEKRLEDLRRRILEVDEALVDLVGERKELVLEIGRLREAEAVTREAEDIARRLGDARLEARVARNGELLEESVPKSADLVKKFVAGR